MSEKPNVPADADFAAAIEARDGSRLRELVLAGEFILINVQTDDDDEEEGVGALTADLDDQPVLVAFTSEAHAGTFVGAMSELFEESDEVQGFLVEGDALLEYLPDEYGLLLNPETDDPQLIDAALSQQMVTAS